MAACATCASVDRASDPEQAAGEDLVLAVERVEIDRVRLAVEAAQHGEHRGRLVAGGDQERDRAFVGLDLVVALVRQAAARGAGVGEEAVLLDLEEVASVVEGDVGDLVREQGGQLGLGSQAGERAGGHVDEAAEDRVALRLGLIDHAEAEAEVRPPGVCHQAAADPVDVGGEGAVLVQMKDGRYEDLVEHEAEAAVARAGIRLRPVAVDGGGGRAAGRPGSGGAAGGEEGDEQAGADHLGSSPSSERTRSIVWRSRSTAVSGTSETSARVSCRASDWTRSIPADSLARANVSPGRTPSAAR